MTDTTISTGLCFPQDAGTGLTGSSEDDYTSAGYEQLLAKYKGDGSYVGEDVSGNATLGFSNVDTGTNEFDIDTGYAFLMDTQSIQSGGQNVFDVALPNDSPFVVCLPSGVSNLGLDSGTNDVWLAVDPTDNDNVYVRHGTGLSAPSDPSVKLGTVDSSSGATTRANDLASASLRSLDTEDAAISQGATDNRYTLPPPKAVEETFATAKNANNPLIGPSGTSAQTTVSASDDEVYEPTIAKGPNGTYWMYAKSDELSGGDTVLRLFSSPDGVSWTVESTTFAPSDSNLTVDSLRNPVLIYDPGTSTWHLYYRGEGNTNDNSIGRASGPSPGSLTDDSSNPILTAADIESSLGATGGSTSVENPFVGDVVIRDGVHYYYGAAALSGTLQTRIYVWVGTGPDFATINPRNRIAGHVDFPRSGPAVSSPSVFYHNGAFWMSVMVGRDAGVAGEDHRETYVLVGDGINFEPVSGVLVDTGASNEWDERWAYGGQWLKKQDGNYDTLEAVNGSYRFYYNGQDTTTGNNGSIGLAEFDSLPYPGSTRKITQSVVSLTANPISGVTQTSAGANVDARATIGEQWDVIKLTGLIQHGDSGETVHAAVAGADNNGAELNSQLSEITKTGSGFRAPIGVAADLSAHVSHLNGEMWVSGGSTGGEALSLNGILYDGKLRETTR